MAARSYNISFVLPMYNEKENIEETIVTLSRFAGELCADYEIIIVDDGSDDGCGDVVDSYAARDDHIKSVRLHKNTGFGGALKKGLESAGKEIIIYTDSDLPAKEEDIKKALQLLNGSDVVTAYSLVIKDSSLKRITMSKVYNFLVHALFGLRIRDINSGLKIYKRSAIENLSLRSRSPFIDVEIFAEAAKRGFKIKQYGLIFELRTKGKSTIARPGIVMRTFWDMIKYRFFKRSGVGGAG